MRKRSLKSITLGGMICALAGVLFYINRQFAGVVDLYLIWILPLPIIIYSTKYDLKSTAIMCISMLLLALIIATPTSLFYIVAAEIAGFTYSFGLKKQKSSIFLIGSVVLVSMFTTLITMYVYAAFFGYNIVDEIQYLQEFVNKYIEVTGLDASVFEQLFSGNLIFSIIVISDIIASIFEGFIVHCFAYIVLKKLKMPLPPMQNLLLVKAPIMIKVYVVGAFVAQIMATLTKVSKFNEILIPVVIIAYIFAISFGYLLFTVFVTAFIKNPKTRKIVVFLVVLLLPITYQTLMIFGLCDMFTNMRFVLIGKMVGGNNNEKQN